MFLLLLIGDPRGNWSRQGEKWRKRREERQNRGGVSPTSKPPGFFPLNKYFFHYFLSQEIHFCKVEGARPLSLTTGLVARCRALTVVTWPQSLARELKPHFSHCRPRPPEIIHSTTHCKIRTTNVDFTFRVLCGFLILDDFLMSTSVVFTHPG